MSREVAFSFTFALPQLATAELRRPPLFLLLPQFLDYKKYVGDQRLRWAPRFETILKG